MGFKNLIVVAGPTAVGKTGVAIRLAQYYNTAVLSADSRQCYREIPIGTAQPTTDEMQGIPHYFIASHSIYEEMNAGAYEAYALQVLEDLFKQHDTVILCGGTGLYIDAVCNGIDEMPPTDKNIEKELQDFFNHEGMTQLQQRCREEDPEFWAVAEQQNPVRLIRALAFKRSNGRSIVHFRNRNKKERPFRIIKTALELPRPDLYENINKRVDLMLEAGLLDEVARFFPDRHLKSLSTVGYSEFYQFEHWPLDKDELLLAITKVKQHSRNYAKRQLTWFRKDKTYQWFTPRELEHLTTYTDGLIQQTSSI